VALTVGLALYTGQRVGDSGEGWYRDAVPLAEAAEAAGFDVFWVSEHHGLPDGYLPSPLTVLAAVASRTTAIGLGTGVLLGPLRHPIRVAEEAVVVDQISKGRLVLGLGLGYTDDELRAFELAGVGRGERLEELIEILRLAWTGEPFSYDGRGARLEQVRVTPTPFGGRQIPIWLGGYAARARDRAARLADGHLIGRGSKEIIESAVGDLEAGGVPSGSPFVIGVNVVAVLDEPGGHADLALEAFERQQLTYERIQHGRDVYGGLVRSGRGEGLTLGSISPYVQVRGSATEIVAFCHDVLGSLPVWATPHISLRIVFPETDLDAQLERVAAFGERIVEPLKAG
jgi:alkanesulfonate monooxygenase SsuD/methylene tetrahydromethanopterin reductase-like flavin-dependent oxidoreductase (luciferase family)